MVEKNAFNYNENNINNRIYTYNTNNTLYKENNDVSNRNRKINNIKKPINKSNNKSSSRFYAYTRPDAKKIIDDMEKNNQKKQTSQEIEDNDEIDITNYAKQATSYQQNDDVEVVKNKYTEGQLIAKQIGVSAKTVEKTRLVLKEASPEQLEAIKKDEISMNQVYKQIQDKKKPKPEQKAEEKAEKATVSPAAPKPESEAEAKAKAEEVKAKPAAKKSTAKSVSKTKTDEAFAKGVRYAISEIRKGISLEDLEKSLSA
jgi:hypothetical protein